MTEPTVFEKKSLVDVMFGYSLLGTIYRNPNAYAMMIMRERNSMQEPVVSAVYFRKHNRTPDNEQELEEAWIEFGKLQERLRDELVNAIDQAERDHRIAENSARMKDLNKLQLKLKETNKPHVMGTVKEIAAKYGKSLSEVRRLKAEGRLDELTLPNS